MTSQDEHFISHNSMVYLSELVLAPLSRARVALKQKVFGLNDRQFGNLLQMAHLNHVVVRGLNALRVVNCGDADIARTQQVEDALEAEHARIATAMHVLHQVCDALEHRGHCAVVIKSLDHWPDLGSDLDLYTDSDPGVICEFMTRHFRAMVAPRSWGDRLAGKWNFLLPGLPEAIEIHIGRLGQTGEQAVIASSLVERSRLVEICSHTFRVPSVYDRIMISTLQRMYRHFYFRLCDVLDTALLAETGMLDYEELRYRSMEAGIWEGVATYLAIVSDYVATYRGIDPELPNIIKTSARFGGDKIFYRDGFLRIPIMPESAGLYRSQLAGVFKNGKLQNCARLSLLPWLASAAVLGQKLTGSDKGIW